MVAGAVSALLPRHLQIIYEINRRFLDDVRSASWMTTTVSPACPDRGGAERVRMAHLAIVGCYSINGVAELHTELLRTRS